MARHDVNLGKLQMWLDNMNALCDKRPYLTCSRDLLSAEFDKITKALDAMKLLSEDSYVTTPNHFEVR